MVTLITGATGLVGYELLCTVLKNQENENIRVLLLPRDKERKTIEKLDSIEIFEGDVTKPETLVEALNGVDTVYHLAAEVRDTVPLKRFYEVNHQGTINILDLFKGKIFIYCSTIGIYGFDFPSDPVSEEEANSWLKKGKKILAGYRESKYMAEKEIFRRAAENNFSASVIRPVLIFGPRDNQFFPKFVYLIESGRSIPLFNKGEAIMPVCYSKDVAQALYQASISSEAKGEDFNIVSYHVTEKGLFKTIADVCNEQIKYQNIRYEIAWVLGLIEEILNKLFGKKPKITRDRAKMLGKSRRFDTTKAKEILGWKPSKPFEEAIGETYSWFKENRNKTK